VRLLRDLGGSGDLSGLVALLTAAQVRVSRLEKQVEAESDLVSEVRSEVDPAKGGG
jgi:hypothetical protein